MEQAPPSPSSEKHHVAPWVIVVAVILVLSGALYWYFVLSKAAPSKAPQDVSSPLVTPVENPDLGTTLYEKSQNPVQGELPETVAPIANPLEGAYKNPFE